MQVLQPVNFFTPRLEYFWTLKVKANKFLLAFLAEELNVKYQTFPRLITLVFVSVNLYFCIQYAL